MSTHQLQLDPGIKLHLTPDPGRVAPKLWIRRLAIWQDPNLLLRDVELRRGLNIIWSPDPSTPQERVDHGIAHGAGKTTLCRMLRYCLGENTYGTVADQRAIQRKLPNGFVGAEVMIDSKPWAVIRPFANDARGLILEGKSLDDALIEFTKSGGASPRGSNSPGDSNLSPVIRKAILGESPAMMPSELGEDGAWGAALAWFSRDSECAFKTHLFWRDTQSESGSPVANMSAEKRANIVRALMGATSSEECDFNRERNELEKGENGASESIRELEVQIKRLWEKLAAELHVPAGQPPDLQALRDAADKLGSGNSKRPSKRATTLKTLKTTRDVEEERVRNLRLELSNLMARVEEKESTMGRLRALASEVDGCSFLDKSAPCPVLSR